MISAMTFICLVTVFIVIPFIISVVISIVEVSKEKPTRTLEKEDILGIWVLGAIPILNYFLLYIWYKAKPELSETLGIVFSMKQEK